jgi:hypothetical protein
VFFLPIKDPLFGAHQFRRSIAVDPKNIEAIRGWPSPKNVSKIRSFMGLAKYYKRFIT